MDEQVASYAKMWILDFFVVPIRIFLGFYKVKVYLLGCKSRTRQTHSLLFKYEYTPSLEQLKNHVRSDYTWSEGKEKSEKIQLINKNSRKKGNFQCLARQNQGFL